MTPDARRSAAALALALVLVLAWGTNFVVLKALLVQLPPGALLFFRYVVAAACAVMLLLAVHRLRWPRLPFADLLAIAGLAFLGHVLHVTMMLHGIRMSTPFSGALISACGPLFTLLILRALGWHRFGGVQLGGLALALAGVLLFLSDKLGGPAMHGAGDLVLLAATMMFSVYTVASRPMLARHGALTVTAYASLAASVPILLLNWTEAASVTWSTLSVATWFMLLWSFIVASFGGWLMWAWVNDVRGVARSAPLLYLLPPIAGITAWLVLDESFGVVKLAGAALALAGVAAAQLQSRPLA